MTTLIPFTTHNVECPAQLSSFIRVRKKMHEEGDALAIIMAHAAEAGSSEVTEYCLTERYPVMRASVARYSASASRFQMVGHTCGTAVSGVRKI